MASIGAEKRICKCIPERAVEITGEASVQKEKIQALVKKTERFSGELNSG